MMKTIIQNVDINANAQKVFEALATEKGLAGWWTTQVKADIQVGGIIEFTFGQTFNPDMEITSLEEPMLVTWKCVGGHEPWTDNIFRFEITKSGNSCTLTFKQEYARELSDEVYGRYNFNWGYYLESLRLLVETGRGKPYHTTTSQEMKTIIDKFVREYKNNQNPDIVDELVADDCKIHIPLPGLPQGKKGMRVNGQMICGAFPDVHVEREFFAIDGNLFLERAHAKATHKGKLMGLEPTYKKVTWTELHAYRIEDGLITEVWSEPDLMGIMVQLGVFEIPN